MHIYGKDYGIAYEGGLSFSDRAQTVFLDELGFDVNDRFTYTYNFNDNWLCDIRIEAIITTEDNHPVPHCISGNRRHGVDHGDEYNALLDVLDKIGAPSEAGASQQVKVLPK